MRRILAIVPFLVGADCGGQTCKAPPAPMTAARAKEIDPSTATGLAVSTTRITGDCTSQDPTISDCGGIENQRCLRERRPLAIQIAPVNSSIPIAEACTPDLSVEDLRAIARFDGMSSASGELVIPLGAGFYGVYVSEGLCARCGLGQTAGACVVEVLPSELTVLDLVLH